MIQLYQHHQQFIAQQTDIILISFGPRFWANAWRKDMDVPFPLLLDLEKDVYEQYDLNVSAQGLLSLKTLWYYIKRRRIPFVKGDPFQLGGNYVIDRDGILRFRHSGDHPSDRPSPETLLDVLQEINS